MQIDTYELSLEEENKILAIYEKLKLSFPKTKISYRKEIIGLGEEGSHLFCYFSLKNDSVSVKFKNRLWLSLYDNDSIAKDIEATINLFKSKELTLSRTPSKEHEQIVSPSNINIDLKYAYMSEESLYYIKICELIPEDKKSEGFSSCSNRLKNALHRNRIFTVQDLISLRPEKIMNIPNFGRKCFQELCDFLFSLSNKNITKESKSSLEIEVEERLQKIKHITESHIEVFIDFSDIILEINDDCEVYYNLYLELLNHLCETANLKLTSREYDIVMSRFGIYNGANTLQEIGNMHSVSRERIRQIIVKATRKMARKQTTKTELLNLECRKINLVSKIADLSASKFLSFLLLQEANIELVKFICKYYFLSDIKISDFKKNLYDKISFKKQQENAIKNSIIYNNKIYNLILFPGRKRTITANDFARLKEERVAEATDCYCTYENMSYQCESYLEQNILYKFLNNNTFKSVKTQSIKIPIDDRFYYPDFQCLTHDNYFVLIEIKPLFNMCQYENIKKFDALKQYCEKYGFGYLILDDHGNSYENINEENDEFSNLILTEIDTHGYITYPKYKQISSQTNASIKHLLTLIKKHSLHFSLPFSLKRT